jgi:4-diphosphocytidyl-2-C-methyl-D-erythritol kinase
MRLLAPAKINLYLRVGPVRDDGFHPLLSWMVTLGLFDSLTLEQYGQEGVVLSCDQANVPTDGSNLVVRAATTLAAALGGTDSSARRGPVGLKIRLEKHIPMGGGLGGGSSDAATTLMGLAQLWRAGLDKRQLAQIGATLGSDVPFFFHAPSAVCAGRGEMVSPTPGPAAKWALLILPGIHMPTPAVYRQFDSMQLADPRALENQPPWQQWAGLPAQELLSLLKNDLEPPAFALSPALDALRLNAQQAIGRIVRMSGSGSSLFSLFDREDEARAAELAVKQALGVRALAVSLAPEQAV